MTDAVKKAVADLLRTVQEIREGTAPAPVHHQDGHFFTFTTPGVRPSEHPSVRPTGPRSAPGR